jgi:hypothetical protein
VRRVKLEDAADRGGELAVAAGDRRPSILQRGHRRRLGVDLGGGFGRIVLLFGLGLGLQFGDLLSELGELCFQSGDAAGLGLRVLGRGGRRQERGECGCGQEPRHPARPLSPSVMVFFATEAA